jgi:hypothetical protein
LANSRGGVCLLSIEEFLPKRLKLRSTRLRVRSAKPGLRKFLGFDREKREALDAWGARLEQIVDERRGIESDVTLCSEHEQSFSRTASLAGR